MKLSACIAKQKSFFKRRNRALTVAGAFIVFMTYVVNEGIRDRYKDIAASVESVEILSTLRNDNIAIIDFIRATQSFQLLRHFNDAPETVSYNEEENRQIWHQEMFLNVTLDRRLFDSVSSLSDKLPGSAQRAERIKNLGNQLHHVELSGVAEQDKGRDASYEAYEVVVGKFQDLRGDLTQMNTELIAIAKDRERIYERYYSLSKWMGYVLYTIGWGLGILGRMAGNGGIE